MSKIARVTVDKALDREFDYAIPDELRDSIRVGCRVRVPFGHGRTCGYVVALADRSEHAHLKAITSLVDDEPFLNDRMLELVKWAARYYCAPIETAIRTALPGAVRKEGARFKQERYVALSEAGGAAEQRLSEKQERVIAHLNEAGPVALAKLLETLAISAAPVRALEKKGLVTIEAHDVQRTPTSHRNILPTLPLDLMPEQKTALDRIVKSMQTLNPPVILLYGVTGSGKTEVYLQAINRVVEMGKGAIVLVPEISLTPQTLDRFLARFGSRVAVLHSHLSDGERHDEWHRIREGRADIVIGARSAVFAPVRNLGLIVVDEEHEPSYKQEDAPRYNARDMAVMRGRIEKCPIVLGSATPSLESWFNAVTRKKYGLNVLPHRADHRKMPLMRVVDMRIETARVGHANVFSQELLDAIQLRIERGEQTILFLNRRGFATSMICPQCGHVANCEQCSVSFTYHRQTENLRCHICGACRQVPPRCPGCGDPAFKFSGFGTQRVESVVRRCFPQAVVERMDADATARKGTHDRILGDFRSGKTQILIGTQMIAKGLHFPNVTLVGVVFADLSLHIPDFRAGERTFQLLAQVAGRAGRGEVSGEVIIQTYTPHHVAVQAARRVDYEGFSDQEIEFRRELSYPPFARLICITLRGRSEERVASATTALGQFLKPALEGKALVSDPSPAPLARAKGYYRYQIMLRSRSVSAMTEVIRRAMNAVTLPKGVKASVDVDAMSLM